MTSALVGALALATAVLAAAVAIAQPRRLGRAIAFAHPDAAALADVGWPHGVRRWETIRAAAVACVAIGALALSLPVVAAGIAAPLPSIWVRVRAEAARDRARRTLSRTLVTIGSALRSGLALPEALRRAADSTGDALAARPILVALRAFDLGAGLDAGLTAAAASVRDERTRSALASLALGIAERLPRERTADLVAALADRASFDERLEEEVRARAAGARQQQRLLAVLVPVLAAYLALTMPILRDALASDLGRSVLIPAGIVFETAGLVLGRRIVRATLG